MLTLIDSQTAVEHKLIIVVTTAQRSRNDVRAAGQRLAVAQNFACNMSFYN